MDEMAKCGHYTRWREDFALVRELGIEYLRYGPPLYTTHLGPGRYDWDFADETFDALQEMRHHAHRGPVPFRRAGLDRRVPEPGLARRCSPSTPAPSPCASPGCATTRPSTRSSSRPRSRGRRLVERAADRATGASSPPWATCAGPTPWRCTRSWRSAPTPSSSRASRRNTSMPAHPACMAQANILNEKRFLSLDLTYGRPVNAVMYEYLLDNGMTRGGVPLVPGQPGQGQLRDGQRLLRHQRASGPRRTGA